MTGWFTHSECLGNGRYEPVTENEVQNSRYLFQRQGLVATILSGRRNGKDVTASAKATYMMRQNAITPHVPSCMDPRTNGDSSWYAMDVTVDFVNNTLLPQLYCEPSNSAAQDGISNAIQNLFHLTDKWLLEDEIQENTIQATLDGEQSDLQGCYAAVARALNGSQPACLTANSARSLCDQVLEWMNQNSDLAFCSFDE